MFSVPLILFRVKALILIMGMLFSFSVLADNHNINLLSMDDHGLNVELTTPSYKLEDISTGDKVYNRIKIDNMARVPKSGLPELPVKGVSIQVPLSGKIEIEVLDAEYESIQDCMICPVPGKLVLENGDVVIKYSEDKKVYQFNKLFPGVLAEVGSRAIFRGTPVANIRIYPFQWNPQTRELRYYSKIRLAIKFDGVLSREITGRNGVEGIFEKLSKRMMVNYKSRERVLDQKLINREVFSRANEGSLKIEIKEDGIYRLTHQDLLEAGIKMRRVDPDGFRLFNQGEELAINVVSKRSGKFRRGDYLEFYAQGIDNEFTDTNIYWLQWGSNEAQGLRVDQINGQVTGNGEGVSSFFENLHIEVSKVYWGKTPGLPREDRWFWEKITTPTIGEYTINVPSPVIDSDETTIRFGLRGRSDTSPHPNHHSIVSLNGVVINDSLWDGLIEFVDEANIAPGTLNDGINDVSVELPGDTGSEVDIIYFNWIAVNYWRHLEAEQDSLKFTIDGDGLMQFDIKGFSLNDVKVYDITDPFKVKEIVDVSMESGDQGFTASFEDQVSDHKTYYVATESQIKQPASIVVWQPADLKNLSNGADYIIITGQEFITSIEPLLQFRAGQGLRVKAVAVESILDEFNFGIFDPGAIKQFLQYAYENWQQPAPTYVLLVGDANLDYRDYLETGKKNIVPPYLDITNEIGSTPIDDWYVSVEGDDILPEMFIGRVSGNSPKQVSDVVNKIIRYEESLNFNPDSILLVADDDREGFETLNNDLIELFSPELSAEKVYLSTYNNVEDATQDIISNIDKGVLITNYAGHGSPTNWSRKQMFESSDVSSLGNGDSLTFVTAMNCANGFFALPNEYSIGEEFVIAKEKGAIASFASSTLGFEWEHRILSKEMFSAIFEDGNNILGAITIEAKIRAFEQGISADTMKSYTLFGDPACKLRIDR